MQNRPADEPVADLVPWPGQVAGIRCRGCCCGFDLMGQDATVSLLKHDVHLFAPALGAQMSSGGAAGGKGYFGSKLCHGERVDDSTEEFAVRDYAGCRSSDSRGHHGRVDEVPLGCSGEAFELVVIPWLHLLDDKERIEKRVIGSRRAAIDAGGSVGL